MNYNFLILQILQSLQQQQQQQQLKHQKQVVCRKKKIKKN